MVSSGPLVMVGLLIALSAWLWARSRRTPINATNVNDAWEPEPERPVAATHSS